MNKLLAILGLLIVLSLYGEEEIAVSYFEASGDIPEQKIDMYTNFLVGEIAAHYKTFRIKGKQKAVENIWEDGEIADVLILKKMGRDLKATYVLTGWLEKLPDALLIKLVVVSTKKGETILRKELKCGSESETMNGIKEFVHAFADYIESEFAYKRINQEARGYWTVGEAFLTLSWYGWAIPRALGITDGKVIVASEMTLPLTVLISGLSATRTRPVTSTHAIGSLGGAYLGIADGFYLDDIFSIKGEQSVFVLPLGLSLIENIGGFTLADKFNWTEGEAELTILSAGEGYLYGLGFGELFNVKSHSARALLALGTRLPPSSLATKLQV